jgi:DNA polymerase I-like protein with 3'-5' exonuclease and polymerase domains
MPKRTLPAIVYTLPEAMEALGAEPRVALDLETSGFSPWRDRLHVCALYGAEAHTIAILHYPKGVPVDPALLRWLEGRPEVVMHNGVQFDALFLAKAGMDWLGPQGPAIFDTMIAEQACTVTERHEIGEEGQARKGQLVNLATAAKRRLGVIIDKTIEHGHWGNPELDENQLAYVTGDITYMLELREAQLRWAVQPGDYGGLKYPGMLECVEMEMELAKVVLQMQLNGITIDRAAVRRYLAEMRERDAEVEPRLRGLLACTAEECEEYLAKRDPRVLKVVRDARKPEEVARGVKALDRPRVEPNRASAIARVRAGSQLLSSSDQLKAMLAIRYGDHAFPSTDKATLGLFSQMGGDAGQLSQDLLRWRRLYKRESMFSEEWFAQHTELEGGRAVIHGQFLQLGTNTGRYAARDPNMQQVPKDMRHCFGNRPGWAFGHSDYAGIELRVMAALAGDEAMIAAFAAGEDIHSTVVAAAFGKPIDQVTPPERRLGKAMNFTMTFGGQWQTFYSYARVNGAAITEAEAEELFASMLRRFSGVAELRLRAERQFAAGRPIMLTFPTGLRRQLLPWVHKPTVLLNNAVQACAAAGLKYAQLEARDAGLSQYLVAVVHDELDYEAPLELIEQVRQGIDQCMLRGMQRAMTRLEPVMIGVESSWGPTWEENPDTLRATEVMSHATEERLSA